MARIYVSSTVDDLRNERLAVMEWLVADGHQPIHGYIADSATVRENALDDISRCDAYVLILGHRYGFQPVENNPERLSITHLEFRRAAHMPRIALLRTNVPDVRLTDLQDTAKAAMVAAFRDEVHREIRAAEFSDLQELILALSIGIQHALKGSAPQEPSRAPVERLGRPFRAAPTKQRPSKRRRKSTPGRRIFLCYRRDDSGPIVGRIYDRLARDVGTENIFKDVDSIPFGVDFVERLDGEVQKCNVLFAVIGPRWLAAGPQGQTRLEDPNDFVRIEIASALRRSILVVPLLVDGAQMPRTDQLPEEIKPLARRNGTHIRHDPDFHADMTRLLTRLG